MQRERERKRWGRYIGEGEDRVGERKRETNRQSKRYGTDAYRVSNGIETCRERVR